MSTYDIILRYLDQLHKARALEAENKVQQYIQTHPNATTQEIEELQQDLWLKEQNAGFLETKVLEAGKFWPKIKKQDFLTELWHTTVPLPIAVITIILMLLYHFFPFNN